LRLVTCHDRLRRRADMTKRVEDAAAIAERKRNERRRSRAQGWQYVSVRLPPGAAAEVYELAALRREEWLSQNG